MAIYLNHTKQVIHTPPPFGLRGAKQATNIGLDKKVKMCYTHLFDSRLKQT